MNELNNNSTVLFSKLIRMDTFRSRLLGLLTKKSVGHDEAYWFDRCSSIHMIGMKFPIDVIFLSGDLRVIKMVNDLKPWRFTASLKAKSAIEVKAGQCATIGLKVGDHLRLSGSGVSYA